MRNMLSNIAIPTLKDAYNLCSELPDVFFAKKETITIANEAVHTVSFNYRLCSYTDFLKPFARNMRGIFYNEDNGELLALPLMKFFNLNENPLTLMNEVVKWKVVNCFEKSDGSLIYFYKINGIIDCRTQNNSYSEQAIEAYNLIKDDNIFIASISQLIDNGYTPCFEYISPTNHNVLYYSKPQLVYLGSRNRNNGEMIFHSDDFEKNSSTPIVYKKNYNDLILNDDISRLISICTDENKNKAMEGFVVEFLKDDGSTEFLKIKSTEYIRLHTMKSFFSTKNVALAVLTDTVDDIRGFFQNEYKQRIDSIEQSINDKIKYYLDETTAFLRENENLNRKDFVYKVKNSNYDDMFFAIAMARYGSKQSDDPIKFIKQLFVKRKIWEDMNLD